MAPNPSFQTVFGVDFSGGKLAGRNIWIAEARPLPDGRLQVTSLDSLETLCGSAERDAALPDLVRRIRSSPDALWGIDFPFGLPIEIAGAGSRWRSQLEWVQTWPDAAHPFGLECVRRARSLGPKLHLRRETDVMARTPFDCYHYRIIYQTFHGMRDVLHPLVDRKDIAVLPFQYDRLTGATVVVTESCPSSTLKRMGLPHQNYKQPAGGPLLPKRLRTRRSIVQGLEPLVNWSPAIVRKAMRNPGGDALDAVIAAVGAWSAWQTSDHAAIAKHARFRHEGYVYF